ncbi:MAG TPA: sodium:proline symporter, partial [Methylomirabilota bacterium]|nr:sodium:proline symporter [Methylomirabilota bacterium]
MRDAGLLLDAALVVVYFVVITAIGLYMGRREQSLSDFALGGRRVPWWAVMASIIAAETSAATFLGVPGEGYTGRSFAYVQLVVGLIIGRIIVGHVFLKPYYTYRVYTVYDYLGVRFGPASKAYVSALFLFMRTLASGTRLFIPSLVMVLAWRMFVSGGRVEFSQQAVTSAGPYLVAIVVLTIVTCLYTAIGGIKAVIWTDVIQAGLMFGGALVAIATLLVHVGGLGAVVSAVPQLTTHEGYFLHGFEADVVAAWRQRHHLTAMGAWEYVKLILASDYTLFSALIGATLGNMAAFGTDQDMVQRMLTAETHLKARRSLITAAFMDLPVAGAFVFIGILLFVYYQQDSTYRPAATADVFGSYILNVMPVGIRGLVLAGIFATAMGSFSAALNALATGATNDWYLRWVRGRSAHHY